MGRVRLQMHWGSIAIVAVVIALVQMRVDAGNHHAEDDAVDAGNHHAEDDAKVEYAWTREKVENVTDYAVALTLFVLTSFMLLTFYMLKCKCERLTQTSQRDTLQNLTWQWLGLIMSIFIAVNLFYFELVFIEAIHHELAKREKAIKADLVAALLSFVTANVWVVLLVCFFWLQDRLGQAGYIKNWRWFRTVMMPPTIKITSHIEGFALLHFMAFTQDVIAKYFCGDSDDDSHGHEVEHSHRRLSGGSPLAQQGCKDLEGYLWLWVLTLMSLLFTILISWVMLDFYYHVTCYLLGDVNHSLTDNFHPDPDFEYHDDDLRQKFCQKGGTGYAHDEKGQSYPNLGELWEEFSCEGLAIGSSYCAMRVLLALWFDNYPAIHQFLQRDRSLNWGTWLATCVILTLIALAYWNYHLLKHKDEKEEHHGEEEEEPWFECYLIHLLNLLAAWSWLQFILWLCDSLWEENGGTSEVLGLVITATITTAICYIFMFPVAVYRDFMSSMKGKVNPITRLPISQKVNSTFTDIIDMLSFVAAFMWERVVVKCMIGIVKGAKVKQSVANFYQTGESEIEEVEWGFLQEMCLIIPFLGIVLIPMYCCWAYPLSNRLSNAPLELDIPVGICPDADGQCAPAMYCGRPDGYETEEEDELTPLGSRERE